MENIQCTCLSNAKTITPQIKSPAVFPIWLTLRKMKSNRLYMFGIKYFPICFISMITSREHLKNYGVLYTQNTTLKYQSVKKYKSIRMFWSMAPKLSRKTNQEIKTPCFICNYFKMKDKDDWGVYESIRNDRWPYFHNCTKAWKDYLLKYWENNEKFILHFVLLIWLWASSNSQLRAPQYSIYWHEAENYTRITFF